MTIDKKLQIKPGMNGGAFRIPDGVDVALPRLDSLSATNLDYLLVFALTSKEIEENAKKAVKALKDDGLLWFAYRKKSSQIKTDINRDTGWAALKELGYDTVRLISIDETWSALRFRAEKYISK